MFFVLEALGKLSFLHDILLKKKLFTHKFTLDDQMIVSPVVSHACATPLSVILCNIEQVLDNPKNTTELLRHTYLAAKQIERLISYSTSLSIKNFDIKKSVDKACTIAKAKRHSVLFIQNNTRSISVKGNSLLFEEALLCLLNNAAEAYSDHVKEKVIVVYTKSSGTSITIIIQDFGHGMNMIAQKIATLKGASYKKNGSGIGFPFAKSVIEKHFFGKLCLDSKWHEGTKITVTIPTKIVKNSHILLQS